MRLDFKNIAHRSLFLLVAGALLILSSFIVSLVEYKIHNLDSATEKLTKAINAEFALNRNLTGRYSMEAEVTASDIKEPLNENKALFIYEKDSLIFWSSNSIPFQINALPDLLGKRILKTPSGYYQVNYTQTGDRKFIIIDLIRHNYRYQNNYLKSDFDERYRFADHLQISEEPTPYKVTDADGVLLFYVQSEDYAVRQHEVGLTFLFIAGFVLLLAGLFHAIRWLWPHRNILDSLWIYALAAVAVRFVSFYFRLPGYLYSTDFFSPTHFASSVWLPSLGDLFLNLLTVLMIGIYFYRYVRYYAWAQWNERKIYLLSIAYTALIIILFFLAVYVIEDLIKNSAFPLNLGNILTLTKYSLISVAIIALALIAFFLISLPLYRFVVQFNPPARIAVFVITLGIIIYVVLDSFGLYVPSLVTLLIFASWFVTSYFMLKSRKRFSQLSMVAIYSVIFAGLASYELYVNLSKKEMEQRKLVAIQLSLERDEISEFQFLNIESQLKTDTFLLRNIPRAVKDNELRTHISSYITNRYFSGNWSKYSPIITLCYPDQELQINQTSLVSCRGYFQDLITKFGDPTVSPSLFFLRNTFISPRYIALIPFADEVYPGFSLVVDLEKKHVPEGLGYPDLLIDKSLQSSTVNMDYAHAVYFEGKLIKTEGEYSYSISDVPFNKADFTTITKNGYNHLVHNVNPDLRIVVSKPVSGFQDDLSPLTYMFIVSMVLFLIVLTIINPEIIRNFSLRELKTQLQVALVALILLSSFILSSKSLQTINQMNLQKNKDNLSEKAHSVLVELDHKLADYKTLTPENSPYLQELMLKFSQVFFSDINLYSLDGKLLATSRPELFNEGLKSVLMNFDAYLQIVNNKRTMYIIDEAIGDYSYLSAYLPFRNQDNEIIAYLNLPYFARQKEIRNEIASILLAFVNIYVVLTALAIMLALFAGNYITQPLRTIRSRFEEIDLEKTNEKIDYRRKDEIGHLVAEYNRMVDKLADSAEKLANTERQTAWREMARQVAHEIKNPLTPMKLSIQHLQRSWNDSAPEWEKRFDRTTETLIRQIDNLSDIASAFSDFAKMPESHPEVIDLKEVIRNTTRLFEPHEAINLQLRLPGEPAWVFADSKQIGRVLINLINNAVQAIPPDREGLITLSLEESDSTYHFEIRDNGDGISESQKPSIFSPNLTTKSGGMGLGLAISKNVIDSAGGKIWFESEENKGTSFYIDFPKTNTTA